MVGALEREDCAVQYILCNLPGKCSRCMLCDTNRVIFGYFSWNAKKCILHRQNRILSQENRFIRKAGRKRQ
ncbi:MAG: hypothetical protein CVV03_07350 [Firmicutes bacterium HGW-Firmicutes-8]|nr:MAG: hypothetical protein CVV03_07350 [Firmicutes bacterium HGW-Firmicutes-8]